jgi:hypothetical protein
MSAYSSFGKSRLQEQEKHCRRGILTLSRKAVFRLHHIVNSEPADHGPENGSGDYEGKNEFRTMGADFFSGPRLVRL